MRGLMSSPFLISEAETLPDAAPVPWPLDDPVPVFAIVGWREGADIGILGAGVLIAPDLILTAGHVVQRQSRKSTRRSRKSIGAYRVYSPWTGIKTVKDITDYAAGKATATGDGLAVLKLESEVPGGLRPLKLAASPPTPGSTVEVAGFGGNDTGILQKVTCRVVSGGPIRMSLGARLGRRDSGSPLLCTDTEAKERRVAGIYAGLRLTPNGGGFERIATAIGEHPELPGLTWEPSATTDGWMEPLDILTGSGINKPSIHTIGIDETKKHTFVVPDHHDPSTILIVSVNATSMPLRSRPRMTVQLSRKGGRPAKIKRDYPGPLQTFRFAPPSMRGRRRRNHHTWDVRTGGDHTGEWTIQVSSETEITYQVTAMLYGA